MFLGKLGGGDSNVYNRWIANKSTAMMAYTTSD